VHVAKVVGESDQTTEDGSSLVLGTTAVDGSACVDEVLEQEEARGKHAVPELGPAVLDDAVDDLFVV